MARPAMHRWRRALILASAAVAGLWAVMVIPGDLNGPESFHSGDELHVSIATQGPAVPSDCLESDHSRCVMHVGVGLHIGPRNGDALHLRDALAQTMVTSYRQDLYWHWLERKRGEYDFAAVENVDRFINWAKTQGSEPVLVLAYGNGLYGEPTLPLSPQMEQGYLDYVSAVVRHFKGIIRYYEVWNEWNIGLTIKPPVHGSAEDYARLLAKTNAVIKSIDPGASVLGGAASGSSGAFAARLFAAGGMSSMDGYSFHPYGFPDIPEKIIDRIERIEEVARRAAGGNDYPLYITEVGWPTNNAEKGDHKGVNVQRSADYLARLYLLASTKSYIKGVWWYDLYDDGDDAANPQHNFGLVRADHTPKPGACTLRQIAVLLRSYRPIGSERQGRGLWVVKLKGEHDYVYAVWLENPESHWSAQISSDSAVTASGICRTAVVEDNGSPHPVAQLSAAPILLTTVADRFTLSLSKPR